MSSNAELPDDIQYYVHRAHELRRQYIAQLWRQGFAALSRVIRWAVQLVARRLKSKMPMSGTGITCKTTCIRPSLVGPKHSEQSFDAGR